jgi:D-alanyl-D-alanine carboxypeptidase (penicillin-binding protein 5/6)
VVGFEVMWIKSRTTRGPVVVAAFALLFCSISPAVAAPRRQQATVTAKAAILVDRQTGVVLWQLNPDLPLPPASTTKVATATLALQSGRMEDALRVSRRAAAEPPSKVALRSGWTMRLRDLVYATMLNSANDASVVIAEGLSGSVEAFASDMTSHARAVGAENTHFVNPNGLPAEAHYSTARDLTRMFDYALDIPEFRRVVETRSLSIKPASGSRRSINLYSKNRLLEGYHVKVVGKTGWTRAARKCFVGAGRIGGRELLVAVLGSDDMWGDVRRLMEFGFDGAPAPIPRWQRDLRMAKAPSAAASRQVGAGDVDEAARFYVRLATFQSYRRASQLTRTVQRDGYPARLFRIRLNGKRYYRVSVGSYRSRTQANSVAKQLERRHPRLDPQLVSS